MPAQRLSPDDILVVRAPGEEASAEGEDTTPEEYRFVIDVMQVGVYLGMRCAAPSLRRAGGIPMLSTLITTADSPFARIAIERA